MRQANTRLPDDTYEEVMDYAEENDISKSEALRRSIRTGIQVEKSGLTRKEEEKEAVTDGGRKEPIRNTLTYLNALWGLVGILGLVGGFVLPGSWASQSFLVALSSVILTGTTSVILWTEVPERIDRRGVSMVGGVKKKIWGKEDV